MNDDGIPRDGADAARQGWALASCPFAHGDPVRAAWRASWAAERGASVRAAARALAEEART